MLFLVLIFYYSLRAGVFWNCPARLPYYTNLPFFITTIRVSIVLLYAHYNTRLTILNTSSIPARIAIKFVSNLLANSERTEELLEL